MCIFCHYHTFSICFNHKCLLFFFSKFVAHIYFFIFFVNFSSLQQLQLNVTDDLRASSESQPSAGVPLQRAEGSVRRPDSLQGTKHLPSVQSSKPSESLC